MLTKRTNVLFDENLWKKLTILARTNNASVGELIRTAVKKVYVVDEKIKQKRMEAYKGILKLRKGIKPISDKEIKDSLHYGHRF